MPSRIETLSQAGFSSEEIQEYIARKRVLFRENGFSDSEVDAYFGIAPKLEDVDTEPFRKSFRERFAAFRAAAIKAGPGEMSQPEPDLSDVEIEVPFKDAVEIGLGGSVTGLLAREKPPRMLPEDASRAERIVAQAAGLAGDFPFMVAGAAIGAGSGPLALVTGTAAAFALPAGLRRVLVETYQNGQIDSFGRFWDVLSATLLDEMKGYATGAAVGATVGVARAAALPAAAAFPIELTTLVKVGAALDGQIGRAHV